MATRQLDHLDPPPCAVHSLQPLTLNGSWGTKCNSSSFCPNYIQLRSHLSSLCNLNYAAVRQNLLKIRPCRTRGAAYTNAGEIKKCRALQVPIMVRCARKRNFGKDWCRHSTCSGPAGSFHKRPGSRFMAIAFNFKVLDHSDWKAKKRGCGFQS